MSHYTVCKTKITNTESLKKALIDMGFKTEQIICNEEAQRLEGYRGDKRKDTAEIIIPRGYVGGAANDIGFKRQADGTYQAIISEFDRNNRRCKKSKHSEHCNGYNQDWLDKLSQRYAYHNVKAELDGMGFYLESDTEENGEIFLECGTSFGY